MGMDLYLQRRYFIGAPYYWRGVTGSIDLWSNGVRIPIRVPAVEQIIERLYYGRKAWWLWQWFEKELAHGTLSPGEEYCVPIHVLDKLRKCCEAVLGKVQSGEWIALAKKLLHCNIAADAEAPAKEELLPQLRELHDALADTAVTNADLAVVLVATW